MTKEARQAARPLKGKSEKPLELLKILWADDGFKRALGNPEIQF
jgi:hypothetical protein